VTAVACVVHLILTGDQLFSAERSSAYNLAVIFLLYFAINKDHLQGVNILAIVHNFIDDPPIQVIIFLFRAWIGKICSLCWAPTE
jgi:hypothetical protein